MARRKKPEGESAQQASHRRALETIANSSSRSEKLSWDRKMDNMVKLLASLRPIEDQIMDLLAKKQPLYDQVAELRSEMVYDCVHPFTHLAIKTHEGNEFVECKFCMKKFSIPNG